MRAPWAVLNLVVAAALAASGCEEPAPKTALAYTENARRAYEEALDQFNAHNWIESQTLMREVTRKYSYSKYARLAELRIADADVEQDKLPEAIREYKEFSRSHPADEEDVAYARSRVAEATYDEIPQSFLMPAPEERDQAAVMDAYRELKSYLDDYPDAKPSEHARDLLARVTGLLVQHELYVARFYSARNNYEAAVARIEYAIRTYGALPPGASRGGRANAAETAEALLLLGQTYLRMHKWPQAERAFESVVQSEASGATVLKARRYLEMLRRRGV